MLLFTPAGLCPVTRFLMQTNGKGMWFGAAVFWINPRGFTVCGF